MLNQMADEFYNSETDVVDEMPVHFKHVYVDGKKVEKVLWKKDCVELDDDEMLDNLKLNIQQKYNKNPARVMKIIEQK